MHERDVTELLRSRMPPENLRILRALGELADRRGTSAYVVGGVVRDLLLDIPNEDLDVVVEEPAELFASAAAQTLGGSVKAHTRFGTAILVVPDGRKVDLATARSEIYERPGALPLVRPGGIREDLRRRDFTINSMAVRINRSGFGTLFDFFSGTRDLEEGRLRVLTEHSFVDDPTRILRGVRFAARFGFSFDDATERLLKKSIREGGLDTVSGERIMNEIVLILKERRPWPPVGRLIDWSILEAIHSAWKLADDLEHTFAEIERLVPTAVGAGTISADSVWSVYLTAMLEPVRPPSRARILERLRAGRHVLGLAQGLERLEGEALRVLVSEREIRRSEIYRAAQPLAPEVLLVAMATRPGTRVAQRVALFLTELRDTRVAIDGKDLADLGVPEGPRVGEILDALLDARLDGTVASEDEERAFAAELAKELDRGKAS